MFSLRNLARTAPRATARLAPITARRSILSTPSVSRAIRVQIPRISLKAFSTTRPTFDAQELAAKLDQELALENENNDEVSTQSDDNVKNFLDSHDWEVIDAEGEQTVKLSRKYEDEIIEVRFSIADFPPPYSEEDDVDDALLDEEDMDHQSGGANTKGAINQGRTSAGNIKVAPEDSIAPADREELRDAEDDVSGSQQSFAINVSVTVRKSSKPDAIRADLVAEDGDFTVHSISHLPTADLVEGSSPGFPSSADKYYNGPPFLQLDEELQSIFENYLSERGIDSSLALFIPDYIDVKEQREYLGWLKRVREFVE